MSAAPWECDIDVVVTKTDQTIMPTEKNVNGHRGSAPVTPDLGHKRPRFSHDNPTDPPITNGISNAVDKSTLGWPFRPDIMQLCRSKFDGKFKAALFENLSQYMTRLSSTEEAIKSLKSDFSELKGCMEHIGKSTDDLKKLVSERATLPVPSSGIGQRRAQSSQVPRQLPPTSQPPSTNPPTSDPPPEIVQKPSATTPSVDSMHKQPIKVSTPASQSSSVTSAADSMGAVVSSALPVSVPSKPAVNPVDLIDLTIEANSTEEVVDTTRNKGPGTLGFPRMPPPNPQCPMYPLPAPMINASQASKVAWFAAHSIPVTMSRNQRAPLLQTNQFSFHQLQRLPVAPLPPIPMQSTHPYPVQPMPQLTIAEAAEGVCLQWTIGYQSMLFEAATAYEIYSYASSELTSETIFTCLPWKKVGEVAALPLPMACTLTHVQSNNMYYFIVRSVDRYRRYSPWSNVVNAYVG